MSYHSVTIGVLTDKHLYKMIISGAGKKIETLPITSLPVHIGDVCTLATQLRISHMWIVPHTDIAKIASSQTFINGADSHLWNIRATYSCYEDAERRQPTQDATPIFARIWKNNTNGPEGSTVFIGFPPYSRWSWQVETAKDLLGTLYYLSLELGTPLEWSPGHTGIALLQQLNSSERRAPWVRKSTLDLETLPCKKAARDLSWKSELPENAEGLYLHCLDANSAYLAACTGVDVGAGTPIHRPVGEITNIQLPGFYRISYDTQDSIFDGAQLPTIINTPWVTSDVLGYAYEAGYKVAIHEAWQFEEKHRTLEQWASKLWNARKSLLEDTEQYPNTTCRMNAYHTIKTIARPSVGWLANKSTPLYRPDWWADVVGRARAVQLRKLSKLYQQGYKPSLIYSDAMYFVSAESNPRVAIPELFTREGQLGGYKCSYSVRIDSKLLDMWESATPAKLSDVLKNAIPHLTMEVAA